MSEIRSIRLGPFMAMWGLHPGGWFRIFGWGLSLTNHKHQRPLFSERYGKGDSRYFHFGDWCLSTLRPLPKAHHANTDRQD